MVHAKIDNTWNKILRIGKEDREKFKDSNQQGRDEKQHKLKVPQKEK